MDRLKRTTYDFEPSDIVSDDIRIGFSDIEEADKIMSRTGIVELPDYVDLLAIYNKHKEAYLYTLERGKVLSENYRKAIEKIIYWRHFDMLLKKQAFNNALKEAELREAELRGRTKLATPTQGTEGSGGSRTRRSRRSRRSIKTRRTRI